MAITACQILQSNDYGSMNQMMTSALSAGWKPLGRMVVTDSPRDFYQMIYQGTDLDIESYQALVNNGSTVPVKNSSGSITDTGTLAISQSVITSVSLPSTSTIVKNSDANINILAATGSTQLATGQSAEVIGGVLTAVRMTATMTVVKNNDSVPVTNSAAAAIANGTATVTTNSITRVALPATIAAVSNNGAVSIPVTTGVLISIGTATRTVTPTVAAGVLTGITIS
ncbi:hypothetical protein [Yokenella regensburgei]|uniref:hypothetical protein n=1 Tax=Yokenella regensburgei TaxID=158877 RepID=UPI0014334541|nr:hypothetical protein [Yokenella regensburgei]QIU92139.1 hypothetical protein HEC60_23835 [Yokenella regensburgei]